MTELLAVPEEKVSPPLSLKELCRVEPLTLGMRAIARARVTAGDVVAVYGCGAVGLGAVVAARAPSLLIWTTSSFKLRRQQAADLIHAGRDLVHDRLQEFTKGSGPEVLVETIGLSETSARAVEEVAFTGRVVYIGYAK